VVQLTAVSGEETKDDDAIAKDPTLLTAPGVSGSNFFGINLSTTRCLAASAMGI